MNARQLDQLRKTIRAYAYEHGVEADIWIEDMPGSDANPAGPRIQLHVLRRIEGQPPRVHPHNAAGYRPDAPDLKARLERDIKEAARALYATP